MEPAVIGLIGVLVSALISAFVARQTSLFQLRIQTDQQFSILLFQNRIDAYQQLYEHLSSFIKVLDFGELSSQGELKTIVSKQTIISFLLTFNEWDSRYAIFMTDHTSRICLELRRHLYKLAGDEEAFSEGNLQESIKYSLFKEVASLEAAIKNEIGIYAIKPFPTNSEFKPIRSYEEIRQLSNQRYR